ncbi:hypothetical protein K490DRAFT_68556 [Saccharata proteae CBS 121410]|uniref:Response regulatory domain-containing protein n=1 Tax=Saccharata proteae CBS 121410 TaxID=1314787 RepID=A0A9P4HRJ4_9PEZI|nr:hypothetical protein K490DRAFT_68556 [Saccharata proteae CBS 121410]
MPHCDGIQVCAEIRRFEESNAVQRAVIFITTGQHLTEDKSFSFGAGASEFYTKPLSLEALDKGIAVYFQNSEQ